MSRVLDVLKGLPAADPQADPTTPPAVPSAGGGGGSVLSILGIQPPADSGGASLADTQKLAKAQKSVNTHLGKIQASTAPKGLKAKAENIAKKAATSPIAKVLSVLDLPRATVVSGLHEIADTVGGGPNTHNFIEGIKQHEGVGSWLKDSHANIWAKRALGFVGDVALDPLTYIAPEETLANLGAKGVARALLDQGAKTLGEEAAREAAAKVARKGISALSEEELASIGAKGGVFLNAPGSGRVGRAVQRLAGVDNPELKQIRILGRTGTSDIARGLQGATNIVRDTKVAQAVGKAVGGSSWNFRQLFRSGDPALSEAGLRILDGTAMGSLKAKRFEQEWGAQLGDLLREAHKAKVDPTELYHAVAAGTGNEHVPQVLVDKFGSWLEGIRQAANGEAGHEFIKKTDFYAPRIRSQEARDLLGGGASTKPFRPSGFEMGRKYKPGEDFLGETLLKPSEAGGKSVEQQIDAIGKRVLGDKYVRLFNDNANESFTAYLKGVSKRVGEKHTEAYLSKYGIVQDRMGFAVSAKAARRAERAARLEGEIQGLRAQEAQARSAEAQANGAYQAATRGLPSAGESATSSPLVDIGNAFKAKAAEHAQSAANFAAEFQRKERLLRILRGSREGSEQNLFRKFSDATSQLHDVTQQLEVAQRDLQKAELRSAVDDASRRQAERLRSEVADLQRQQHALTNMPGALEDAHQAILDSQAVLPHLEDIKQGLEAGDQQAALDLADLTGFDPQELDQMFPSDEELHGYVDSLIAEHQQAITDAQAHIDSVGAQAGPTAPRTVAEVQADIQQVTADMLDLKRQMRATAESATPAQRQSLADYREAANALHEELRAAQEADPIIGMHGGPDAITERRQRLFDLQWDGKKGELDSKVRGLATQAALPDLFNDGARTRHLIEPFIREMTDGVGTAPLGQLLDDSMRPLDGFVEELKPIVDKMREALGWTEATFHPTAAAPDFSYFEAYVKPDLQSWVDNMDRLPDTLAEFDQAPVTNPARTLKMYQQAVEDLHGVVDQAKAAQGDAWQAYLDNKLANAKLEQDLLSEMASVKQARFHDLHEERVLRMSADSAFAEADRLSKQGFDAQVVQVLQLKAAADKAAADLQAAVKARVKAERVWAKLGGADAKVVETHLTDLMRDGFASWGPGKMAPDYVVAAMQDVTKLSTPEGARPLLKAWDGFTQLWKAYAIATPGFHFRNMFGGFFNNWLAGVEMGSYRRYLTGLRDATKGVDSEEARLYNAVKDMGITTGGQTSGEVARTVTGEMSANPLSTQFAPLAASFKTGTEVENLLRGALAMDVLAKGGTSEHAIDQVFKYHFNYEDLSHFETTVVKRVIPFYTWTRKNLPLQIESMIRQPGKYNRYLTVKRNVELGTPEESIVPGYFGEQLGVRLPFQMDGQRAYVLPDLPFRDLTRAVDPGQALGQMNPLIKTPLELRAGKQFFNDIPFTGRKSPVPKAWEKVPGLMPVLATAGMAVKDKNGDWLMSDRNAYKVEQALPLFGRLRRQFPSEARFNQRTASSWLSFTFGVGVRTNTVSGQYSELKRRDASLNAIIADLQDRKIIPKRGK